MSTYEEAYLAYERKDYEVASLLFAKLTSLEPLVAKYWKGVAASLQMEKKFEDALKAWSMLALLEADSAVPHFHAAECLLALNQKEEGIKALALAQKNGSSDRLLCEKIDELRRCYDCICA